jgi:large conductance mechanosensitive channel
MLKEFKAFVMRGNVMDMAVGIIIGAAFGKIVTSLVNDVIMPPIGLLLGHVDFAGLFVDLSGKGFVTLRAAQEAGAPTINYGVFISSIINFAIVAFAVFMMIRVLERLRKKEEPPSPPSAKECPHCLSAVPAKASKCAFCTSELA